MKDKEIKEVAIMPKKELVLEGDPEAQLQFAMKAANALMRAVSQKKNPVMIRGEQYLEYGDWQTLARFFGATAAVAWTKPLVDLKGATTGYEARAEVLHQGVVISSAEAMCMRSEANWRSRDEFMLRSMAQTRAAAKALRNAYGWVAELAGMKSTPAEEMDGVAREPMKSYKVERVIPASDDEAGGAVIQDGQFLSNGEIEATNEMKKNTIKTLLKEIGEKPKTLSDARTIIYNRTGILFETQNYDKIIKALKELDPIEALDTAISDKE